MPDLKGTNEVSNLNEQMRAEFEASRPPHTDLSRDRDGNYHNSMTRYGWSVWQDAIEAARRQHGSAAPVWKGNPYCWFHEPTATVHRTSFQVTKDCFALYTEQQAKELFAPPVADAEGVKELREALETLVGMAEAFPDELGKDHPDVMRARAALSRRPAAEQPAAEQAKAAHVDWRNKKVGRPAAAGNALTDDVVARAMAKHAGWDGWDTATDCRHTPSGNEPEDERQYWRDLASVAAEHLRAAPQAAQGEGLTIDSPEFRQLAHRWQMCLSTELESSMDALIAHIDAKLRAIAAHTRASDGLEALIVQHRAAIIPEYESGYQADIYGEFERSQARGFGATPREALDKAIAQNEALAAMQAKSAQGGA